MTVSAITTMRNFNPPSPCGEGREVRNIGVYRPDFNPPSPCGEGLTVWIALGKVVLFQSTLPVWGGTSPDLAFFCHDMIFQSTLPVWGGTSVTPRKRRKTNISIHPPRVGRDPIQYIAVFLG